MGQASNAWPCYIIWEYMYIVERIDDVMENSVRCGADGKVDRYLMNLFWN